MKRVCIIGHFGHGENLLNGQTVKTKIVTKEIVKDRKSTRLNSSHAR